MNQKNLFTRSALAVAVSLTATQAFAAGFQLNEYSTSALGRAFSGEGPWQMMPASAAATRQQ